MGPTEGGRYGGDKGGDGRGEGRREVGGGLGETGGRTKHEDCEEVLDGWMMSRSLLQLNPATITILILFVTFSLFSLSMEKNIYIGIEYWF